MSKKDDTTKKCYSCRYCRKDKIPACEIYRYTPIHRITKAIVNACRRYEFGIWIADCESVSAIDYN